MDKKILIVSHNPASDYNNMGKTISALFGAFSKEDLYQLYFYSGYPNVDLCSEYYRINDKDMLKSFFLNKSQGTNVEVRNYNPAKSKSGSKSALYSLGARRLPLTYAIRDKLWKKKYWMNENLVAWLDKVSPDMIFYASGDSLFSYRVSMEIALKYNIPLVTYFCDDYYFYSKYPNSFIYRRYKKRLVEITKKIVDYSSELIYIVPALEKAYKKEFGKPGKVIMTPADILPEMKITKGNLDTPVVMSYIGNVDIRMDVLMDIGDAVNNLNRNKNIVEFNLYTANVTSGQKNLFKLNPGINYKGAITAKEVKEKLQSTDIVLHVESFDKKLLNRVRYAISTKIPESMGMAKCIFAYGPYEAASIEYLKINECACICTEKEKLESTLLDLIEDGKLRKKFSENALETANKNHSVIDNSQRLKDILFGIITGDAK